MNLNTSRNYKQVFIAIARGTVLMLCLSLIVAIFGALCQPAFAQENDPDPIPNVEATPTPTPSIGVESNKTSICAGGIDSDVHKATITIVVTKDDKPVKDVLVSFSVEDSNSDYPSSLSASSATTDDKGEAIVKLTSSKLIGATAKVKATYSGVEEITTISMGAPTATWDINPTELIADGESSATVKATLTFGGVAVDQHPVTWSISEVQDEDGNPVSLDSGDYGSLTPLSGTTGSDGSVTTTYKVGTEPGTVTFQIVDDNLYEQGASSSQMRNSLNSSASAIGDGSTGTVSIGKKRFTHNKNLVANVFYVYTLVNNDPSGSSTGTVSGAQGSMKFTVALKALVKRSGSNTPTLKSVNFNEFRPVNSEQSSPILGVLDSTGTPAGAFTTWAYKSASPHWDITTLRGKWNVIVKLTNGSTPRQERAIFKIDKRNQIVKLARTWIGFSLRSCGFFTSTVYNHLGMPIPSGTDSQHAAANFNDSGNGALVFFSASTTNTPGSWDATHVAIRDIGREGTVRININSNTQADRAAAAAAAGGSSTLIVENEPLMAGVGAGTAVTPYYDVHGRAPVDLDAD